jgi:DNA-binding transcriptional MerR regulator
MAESGTTMVSDDAPGYRTGVAARLAGVPVDTLRVWERRYGITDTARSARGQRLYSYAQVQRIAQIKRLVDQGHQVGSLVRLDDAQLRALAAAAGAQTDAVPVPAQPIRVAMVGQALAQRLAGGGRALLALDIVSRCADLDGAGVHVAAAEADVLLIEVAELGASAIAAIVALRVQFGGATLVLYRFSASAAIHQLREHGCLVARAPADAAEVVLLCRAALHGAQPRPFVAAPLARRFDDNALAALVAAGSSVACECPRHLSDIIQLINSFERYSVQCADSSPADADLHRQLGHTAASARSLLETALLRLARADGLPLPLGL